MSEEGRGILSLESEAVVIGGGIVGLSTAYYLAKRGITVIILEKGYVGSGSSTRNASHFRVHFSSRENTMYAVRAVKKLKSLRRELGWNPLIMEGGYLWLMRSEESLREYERLNEELWKPLGVPVRILTKDELNEQFPYINTENILGGVYGPQDGSFHHDYVIMGYYHRAKDLGVRIYEGAEARKIGIESGRVTSVSAPGIYVKAKIVVIAAGAWTGELMRSLGIDVPVRPVRKEICVTVPTRYFMKPLIVDMGMGIYVGQTMRGEVIGSGAFGDVEGFVPYNNTLKWLSTWAQRVTRLIPSLGRLRVMRTWSGYYEVTPDHSHIMGRSSDWPEGIYVAAGFSGHGFMMGPLTGEIMANHIVTGDVDPLMEPFLPDRFRVGRILREAMVI